MSQTWEPERVTIIDDTLKLEWYAKDTMLAYVLSDMSQDVLHSWSETALYVLNKWPLTRPYLALYDLSCSGVVLGFFSLAKKKMCSLGITGAGEAQVMETIAQNKDFSARVALYISMSYSGHLGGFLAEVAARKTQLSQIKYEVFYNREAALNWLNTEQT